MKKFLIFSLMLSAMVALTSCKHKAKSEVSSHDASGVLAELVVENTISADRQYMYLHYKADYRWFETCILLNDYMDEECDGSVFGVSSIFQVVYERGNGFDTKVIMTSHSASGDSIDVKDDFWLEDSPMNEDAIKISYKEAFDKMMATNYPKPHSRHCVLRKQVGAVDCNPQYIFGNSRRQIYVDAVNGSVSDKNPAFGNLNMPLGEWP